MNSEPTRVAARSIEKSRTEQSPSDAGRPSTTSLGALMATQKKTIAIAGDVTIDWMLLNPGGGPAGIEFHEIWGAGFECAAAAQAGGAAMLAGLMERLVAADQTLAIGRRVVGPVIPREALASPAYDGLNRTWTSWALLPAHLCREETTRVAHGQLLGPELPGGLRRSRAGLPDRRLATCLPGHRRLQPGLPHGRARVVATARRGRPADGDPAQDDRAADGRALVAAAERGLCRLPDGGGLDRGPAQGQRAGRDPAVLGAHGLRDRRRRPFDRAGQGGPRRRSIWDPQAWS